MRNLNKWAVGALLASIGMTSHHAFAKASCTGLPTGAVTFVFTKLDSILEAVKGETVTISGTGTMNASSSPDKVTVVFKAPFSTVDLQGTDADSKRLFLARNCTDYARQAYATSRQLTIGGALNWTMGQDGSCLATLNGDSGISGPETCGISTYVKPIAVPPPLENGNEVPSGQ